MKTKNLYIVTKWESDRRNHKEARAHIVQFNFHSIARFDNDMFAIQLNRLNINCDKPMYLGFSVLELSKWKMYDFHYS